MSRSAADRQRAYRARKRAAAGAPPPPMPEAATILAPRPLPLAQADTREALYAGVVAVLAYMADQLLEDFAAARTAPRRARLSRTITTTLRELSEVAGARVARDAGLDARTPVSRTATSEARADWERLPEIVRGRLPPDFLSLSQAERIKIVREIAVDLTRRRQELRAGDDEVPDDDCDELEGEEVPEGEESPP